MSISKTNRNYEAGFTLLEMILSVFILSMIMLVVGTSLYLAKDSLDKVDKKNRQIDTYLNLDRVFSSSIRNAIPFTWPDSENKEVSIFAGNRDSVMFAYLHRIISESDGGIRFIRFYLKDNRFIADYRKIPFFLINADSDNLFREILADDIEELNILYADRDTENMEIVWSSGWHDTVNIPLAIQISLKWKDGTEYSWLRRTAGSGQSQSYGVKQVDKKKDRF